MHHAKVAPAARRLIASWRWKSDSFGLRPNLTPFAPAQRHAADICGGRRKRARKLVLIAGFCGPGSLTLLGFLALIALCGGSFGLPKAISLFTGVAFAVVIVAAVTTPPTAVAANMSRLENIFYHSWCKGEI